MTRRFVWLLCVALAGCTAGAAVDEDDPGAGLALPDPTPLPDPDASLGDEKSDAPATACTSLAHVGDSLSAYTLPGLEREYRARGVGEVILAAHGGRAILQKLSADPETGRAAAIRIAGSGFAGCWVVALGTNDTADIAVGASYGRGDAIDRMMRAIDASAQAPVMWVNTFTTRSSGPWSNAHMIEWNDALERARARWPNLVVFDWAKQAARGVAPFVDGIHHTSAGFAVRNRAIADALAAAFPR